MNQRGSKARTLALDPKNAIGGSTLPRPRIGKKVCCLPENTLFGPLHKQEDFREILIMSVEEYETIRLIDYEGFTQEGCAAQMQVARGTVQKLYTDAREKIAQSLVEGKNIRIEGGDYLLYDEEEKVRGCRRCRRGQGHGRNLGVYMDKEGDS